MRLLPGIHDVRGELVWDALPELLQIPAETGLLAVSQNGEPVAFPKRDAQGRLWLHTAAAEGEDAESRLEITVHRRVTDEIPLRVTTRIRLEVSGPAREVVLGRALPEGAIPMSLWAPLPARLDPDGKLRVQVRPGSWARRDRGAAARPGRGARASRSPTAPGTSARSGSSMRGRACAW